jgi:hypothetical protein
MEQRQRRVITRVARPDPGQRIEVLLQGGLAAEWVGGIVLPDGAIALDEEPPGVTLPVSMDEVADWRPA